MKQCRNYVMNNVFADLAQVFLLMEVRELMPLVTSLRVDTSAFYLVGTEVDGVDLVWTDIDE